MLHLRHHVLDSKRLCRLCSWCGTSSHIAGVAPGQSVCVYAPDRTTDFRSSLSFNSTDKERQAVSRHDPTASGSPWVTQKPRRLNHVEGIFGPKNQGFENRFETHPSMPNEQLGVLMKSILLDSFSPAGAWFTCVEASTSSIRSSVLLLGCEMDNKFMFHRHHVSVRRQCEITK